MRNDDFVNGFVSGQSIAPASYSGVTPTTGAAINFQQCDPEIAVLVDVGAVTGTSALAVTLTQCQTSGGSYTPISGFSVPVVAAQAGSIVVGMCISRQANYVKAVGTQSGNSGSPVTVYGVILICRLKIF